jgi:hypothetical protein
MDDAPWTMDGGDGRSEGRRDGGTVPYGKGGIHEFSNVSCRRTSCLILIRPVGRVIPQNCLTSV